jgi:hypothetical protein
MIAVAFYTLRSTLLTLCLLFGVAPIACADIANLGRWSEVDLSKIISSANLIESPGAQVVVLSNLFVDTPYAENTLVGGPQEVEQLVLNLDRFDCFTFLDVVESLRRASDSENLLEQLKGVRYTNGMVTYANRRHFFSDWVAEDVTAIEDVTDRVGQGRTLKVSKQLNRKADGSLWLPGIAIRLRQIYYIPTASVDADILSALQPGDYIGIYSYHAGLDVNHTGLIVKSKGRTLLRHASSRSDTGRVVDEDLLEYLHDKPGILVYRVKP